MRDIFLMSLLFVLLLATLRRPQVGLLTWLWISVMNPHRLAYGFSYDFPLLDIVAAVTILSCAVHWKDRRSSKYIPPLKLLTFFYVWCTLTTIFSVDFMLSLSDWLAFSKTLILTTLLLFFMCEKHWILAAVGIFVASIAFFTIKGGIFTVLTGGAHRVYGAPGTMWGTNNGVSIAALMALPLCIGIRHCFASKLLRFSLIGVAISTLASILGTQSRGGLVGLIAACGLAILRSQRRLLSLIVILFSLIGGFFFMPETWHARMSTIVGYEEDTSASNRLIQWEYAIDISLERPLFGNGFEAFFHQPYYNRYVAHKDMNRAVHSNYFQVLGEQGYIGLMMYLSLGVMCVITCKKYAKHARDREDLKWASALLDMLQFAFIGYAFNGITLNMAYLDLYYYLIAIMALLVTYVVTELEHGVNQVDIPRPGRR